MPRPHRLTVDQRRALVDRFERSGLGPSEFCKRERLSLSSFQRWRREAADETAQPGFIELSPPTPADSTTEPWSLEMDLPGGLRLRLQGGR